MALTFVHRLNERLESGRWPLAALLALCIARLWLLPLPSGFWLDELVTKFVVMHPGHPSFAVAPQVPQSIYYWLPRATVAVAGPSEISLRIPSMLVMAVALWLISRLAARLIHPRAGWFAVFACLLFKGINYQAIDARPYGLGMMTAAASLFFLVRWLDSARWSDTVLFVLFSALVWRVHLLLWPFYLLIVLYALVRLVSGSTAVRWPQWIAATAALTIALLPVAASAISLTHGAHAHVFAQLPTLHVFEHELHWIVPLECGAAAWLLSMLLPKWRNMPKPPVVTASALVLIFGLWLLHPLCLYVYSIATGNSVYVSRYLSLLLPGAALATTFAVSRWIPADRWRVAAAILAVMALAFQGRWESHGDRHDDSDWRAAAHEVNLFAPDASTPVIAPSPFIEARPPAWTPDYPLPGFLYAHLDGYPVTGKLYLLPFEFPAESPAGVAYAATLSEGPLSSSPKWAVYGQAENVREWSRWFLMRPQFVSWRVTMKHFGDVSVAEFGRSTSGTSATPQR